MKKAGKLKGVVLVILGVIIVAGILLAAPNPMATHQSYGVSFSAPHASGIGLDWKKVYDATLTDLGVKHLRLSAYWNQVEPRDDEYDFDDLDYQMDQAAAHRATVILGVGRKLPRWPECHTPDWASELPEAEQQQEVLEMIEVVVKRYKEHPALLMWQLENEPLLDFGICPPEDRIFVRAEERLLRSVDSTHPILMTDSGELNWWIDAARFGDVLGTTMYRTVFSSRTNKPFHYDYLFPSWLYRFKSRYIGLLYDKPVLISELQGEPWGQVSFTEMNVEEKNASFSVDRFYELADFAGRTQLPSAYWWGVEYWYWEKEVKENPVFWETAIALFGASNRGGGDQ